jgi:hypothetical protein
MNPTRAGDGRAGEGEPRAIADLAWACAREGRTDDACTLLRALAAVVVDERPWVFLAAVLHAAGRMEEALVAADRGLAIAPASDPGRSIRAIVLRALGRYGDADASLERLPGVGQVW